MACVHNQATIAAKKAQIAEKESQIASLSGNVNKCIDMIANYESYGKQVDCVINNLEGNYVEAGKAYDDGAMTLCKNKVDLTIDELENIKSTSKVKQTELNSEITVLNSEIAGLQGDCGACTAAKMAAQENSAYMSSK